MKPFNISMRYAFILATVALVCTSFSVGIYWLTKDKIDNVIAQQQRQFLNEVIPHNIMDNDILATCKKIQLADYPFLNRIYFAKKRNKVTAYAIQSTAPNGYAGDIVLLEGFQLDRLEKSVKVLGVRVLTHNETPGLGDKIDIRISDWILSFNGKKLSLNEISENKYGGKYDQLTGATLTAYLLENNEKQWFVKKDGGTFDQFTGATVTPRAVVNNVRESAKWFVTTLLLQPKLIRTFPDCN
ncbi:electron transport complex subunit RsxG [Pasteurella atlantica]|uniref:Ion-translocating oxidoreductase complex subunit G n=4 Tax=Pasteurellaceae TaxID=712 RepID=A0AAJ6NF06_9PAST|nr:MULTISPECIES: electron transport complex subunit RsxG [Pasteurella]MBR0573027.1 electron transport complex subunit RsxG [Pasteurella atlantica]MDP8033160.1 electron transport complex subunit RsxG [Pasteurella atlantica]MDP8035097.1 electron transport complex subunit RsxG [Pasteurella atlantica]MDP8036943.1 electron transport complex subunit RsxG [Pasteurella atlantica]MDP8038846.1 electron transport complex subunit RsxG [Pasteurella atlantica]